MDQKELVQKDVADGLGMNQARISDWFRGVVKKPHRATLRKLSDYFGCGIDWLADGTGEPFPTAEETDAVNQPGTLSQQNETFSMKEMVSMAMEILESDTEYKPALVKNIRVFHQAVAAENEMKRVKKKMAGIIERMDRMEQLLISPGAILPEKRDKAANS